MRTRNIALKDEELVNRDTELGREHFQIFKGWSVDSAFDKAEKVDRDLEQFCELLLAHPFGKSNRLETIAEFLAKGRQVFAPVARMSLILSFLTTE